MMAMMRYMGICHPFWTRSIDGQRFAQVAYLIISVICILFNLPHFFTYKLVQIDMGNEVVYLMDLGSFDLKTTTGLIYIWSKAALSIVLPLGILGFCNCSLIRALRRSYRMRQQYHVQQTASNTSHRITLTLIIIIVAFFFLVLPSEIMDSPFLGDHIKKDMDKSEMFLFFRSVSNVLQIINFSFNFLLYCAVNVHFRGILLEMLPCLHRLYPNVSTHYQTAIARNMSYKSTSEFTLRHTSGSGGPKVKGTENLLESKI